MYLTNVNGTFISGLMKKSSGVELWKHGTTAGTVQLKDICPGPDK